jgi:hypothetical protein
VSWNARRKTAIYYNILTTQLTKGVSALTVRRVRDPVTFGSLRWVGGRVTNRVLIVALGRRSGYYCSWVSIVAVDRRSDYVSAPIYR